MAAWLKRQGQPVNPKRVRRLMRLMLLAAVYPKPNLSKASPEHKIYPYLLSNTLVDHPDQVWAADITYIRMQKGFVYLVTIAKGPRSCGPWLWITPTESVTFNQAGLLSTP